MLVLDGQVNLAESDDIYTKEMVKSEKLGQLLAHNRGFYKFIPMATESEAGDALSEFIQDVGIPKGMHTDGSKAETMGRWKPW